MMRMTYSRTANFLCALSKTMLVMQNSTKGLNVGATYHVARNHNAATSGDQIDSVEKHPHPPAPYPQNEGRGAL